jgi:hypothetical protein
MMKICINYEHLRLYLPKWLVTVKKSSSVCPGIAFPVTKQMYALCKHEHPFRAAYARKISFDAMAHASESERQRG